MSPIKGGNDSIRSSGVIQLGLPLLIVSQESELLELTSVDVLGSGGMLATILLAFCCLPGICFLFPSWGLFVFCYLPSLQVYHYLLTQSH